jgi:hypothetical protein
MKKQLKKKKKKEIHEHPVAMEHPNLFDGNVYVEYRLGAEQLRTMFELDAAWKIHHIGTTKEGLFTADPGSGARITFRKTVLGPIKAMEILGGAKEEEK